MLTRVKLVAALAVAGLVVLALAGCGSHDGPAGQAPSRTLSPARVGSPIELGGNPVAVAVGAGAIWVVDASRQTLTKVDPATRSVVGSPHRIAGGPFAVAVGEGLVWVAAGDGSVRAYDPRSGRRSGPAASVPGANGLAVGAGGVWVTSRRAGTVTRIDPRTRSAAALRVGRGPADVAVGLGAVWVANADGASVTRIDPRRGRVAATIAVGERQVLAVAVGEQAVWVVRAGGFDGARPQLVRIDPQSDKLAGAPISVPGTVPLELAAGDGVWVTDAGAALGSKRARRGGVTRIDPAARAPSGPPLRTGDRPSAIALGEGGAWVTNEASGTLTPILVAPQR